ncbi:MAG: sigma 54-interacting transcriptional regulator [Candidatus Hydrogenedentota bacterium]
MRPTRLSAQVFLELPPVLAHYLKSERNHWLESSPKRGTMKLLERPGVFEELEGMAVQSRHLVSLMGLHRARALAFRCGYEQGRRDGQKHLEAFNNNVRLALQAAPVYAQLEGRYQGEQLRCEFDMEARTLHREIRAWNNTEALAQRMAHDDLEGPACWKTAGYLAGHTSELLGRRVLVQETECAFHGWEACRFVGRFDGQWDCEADWMREALRMEPLDKELARRDELVANAQRAARRAQKALNDLSRRLKRELALEDLVASSESMASVVKKARHLARNDAPILLCGEAGTGKETMAKAIHNVSVRCEGPFVAVDCADRDEAMLLRELFGRQRGADDEEGAPGGAFAQASGGTLYLSEVGGLPPAVQGQVLEALEANPNEEAPGSGPEVRLISSTERDLCEQPSGGLREDFYYAVATTRLDLPPLRARGADILGLAEAFVRQACQRYNRPVMEMTPDFKQTLLDCAWPGNVRQLRNAVEHAAALASGEGPLDVDVLPEEILTTRWRNSAPVLTAEVIQAALRRTGGNRSHAAELLGVGRTTLWRAMKRFDLS